MKTKSNIGSILKVVRQFQFVILFVFTSFILIGGCGDEKAKEIPADEVTTTAVQAEAVPAWVPANTSPDIRFYFIPEIGIYYDAFVGDYVYRNGIYWVYSPVLPHAHLHFDLYDANIVFLSVGVVSPWHYHSYYVAHYPVYYFIGVDFYASHHGYRFYNENGIGFYGPHKHVKYNVHYTVQNHYKGGREKFKYDYSVHKKNQAAEPGTGGRKEKPDNYRDEIKTDKQRKEISPDKKQEQHYKKDENIKRDVPKEGEMKKTEPKSTGGEQEIKKGTQQKKPLEIKSEPGKKETKPSQKTTKKGGGGKGSD